MKEPGRKLPPTGAAAGPPTAGQGPTTARRRVALNVGALTLARGATMVLTLVTYAHLTRVLGPDGFGIIGWATVFVGYFAAFVEMGLGTLCIREVARDPSQILYLGRLLVGLRVILLTVALASFYAVVLLLDKPSLFKAVVALQGLSLVGFASSLDWAYYGTQRMGRIALRNVVVAMAMLVCVALVVRRPDDLLLASAVLVGAALLSAFTIASAFIREYGVPWPRMDLVAFRALLKPSIPIGAGYLLAMVSMTANQALLGLIRPVEEVGWYAGAYRLLTAALVGIDVLYQAFLPVLSGALHDRARSRVGGHAYAVALAAVGLPIAVGSVVYAREILTAFAGAAYAPGTRTFALLMVYAAFAYTTRAYGDALVAWDRERDYLTAVAAAAVLNIALSVVLIPLYGLDGAALAMVATGCISLAGTALPYHRAAGTLHLGALARVGGAVALGVGVPVVLVKAVEGSLWMAAAAAIPAYAVALFLCHVVEMREGWKSIRLTPPG